MTYATATDVQTLAGRSLTPEETALAERRLDQVERMILRRIPDLDGRIASGALVAADVADVEAEAVLRVIRNPDGIASETDGTYGYTRSREAADNSLRITAEEWKLLGVTVGKMFAITPALGRRA